MAKPVIVKVQRPLFTSDPELKFLVYDEQRHYMTEQPQTKKALKALGSDMKGYFEGWWHPKQNIWHLGNRVKDRNW